MQIQVLFEDNHLIAVNKPACVPCQPDQSGDESLIDIVKQYIKKKYDKPGDVFLGLTHRIDRPVSGIVLFAKTSKALSRINEMFKNQEIKKTYWALVKNAPKPEFGTLENWLVKDAETFKTHVYEKEKKGAKKAILDYKLISRIGEKNLLEIKLHTGRHHQIRAQLSKIDSPIIGDTKYGYKRPNEDRSICLHSKKMEFTHPVKDEIVKIDARTPNNPFWTEFK